MHLYLMALEIQLSSKYHKLLFEACGVCARIMLIFEMLFELLIVLKTRRTIRCRSTGEKSSILLIPNSLPFANKAFFVMLTEMSQQFIVTEETFPTELTHRMDYIR
jgi:hypothetical protein